METFDPTTHHVNAAAVRQRLEAGKRDDGGRFRITPGSSLLHEKARACTCVCRGSGCAAPALTRARKQEPEGARGISLAKLQAEADAERAAKEAARHKKRKAAPEGAAAGDKAAKAKPADAVAPDAPPRTWLVPGLVVKLLAKDTPALHKAKGAQRVRRMRACRVRSHDTAGMVREVLPQARAEVELLEGGARHVMREAQLETVLPKPGGKVRLRGTASPCVTLALTRAHARCWWWAGATRASAACWRAWTLLRSKRTCAWQTRRTRACRQARVRRMRQRSSGNPC